MPTSRSTWGHDPHGPRRHGGAGREGGVRHRYEMWLESEAIAGPMYAGSLSACLRYARMMGGKDWLEKGYHVDFAID